MLNFESTVRQGGDFEKVFEGTAEFRPAGANSRVSHHYGQGIVGCFSPFDPF